MGRFKALVVLGFLCAVCVTAVAATPMPNSTPPVGNYLWFPRADGPKSDADCKSLVVALKPTDEQVQQWYWGRAPNDYRADTPFFLIVTPDRIETTFSAEGDFDSGEVKFGETHNGETTFTLKPDDHPNELVKGKITAKTGSAIVTLTLFAIPYDDESKDRVSYFCRFDSPGIVI